jgi:YggT family protein
MDVALSLLARVSYWALTIYLWMVIAAVLLSWVSPDPRNPIVAFLNRVSAPLWNGMARVLPSRWRLFSSYAALLLVIFLIEFVPGVLTTLALLAGGRIGADALGGPISGFFLRGVGVVLDNTCYFLILMLAIWFVLTLVSPSVNNPLVRVVYFLVDPIISPLQRILPRMRIDLSPVLAAAAFLAFNTFVVSRLLQYSYRLTAIAMLPGLPGERM